MIATSLRLPLRSLLGTDELRNSGTCRGSMACAPVTLHRTSSIFLARKTPQSGKPWPTISGSQILTSPTGLYLAQIEQFADLWEKVSTVALEEEVEDSIIWKFSKDGTYSPSSAYKAQFEGLTSSDLVQSVWRVWAPPRCKFFAWLVLQNRVWTSDRLIRRGWPNCGLCPLCKQAQEFAAHLLFQCRFTLRIWNDILPWLGMHHISTSSWSASASVKGWWNDNLQIRLGSPKALASLMMLISWEIWSERNARVVRNVAVPPVVIINKIKQEVSLWALAGAKHLGIVMPRE